MNAYTQQLVIESAINIIAALGLFVVVLSGQLSVGNAALAGIAGYASGLLSIHLGLPLFLSVAAGGVISALIGGVLSLAVGRLQGFYLAIATLGFGQTVVVIITNWPQVGGADGLSGIPIVVTLPLAVVTALVIIFGVRRWETSRSGQAVRAVGEDPLAAAAIGVAPRAVKRNAFMLGGLIAGLAGGLQAHYIGLVSPDGMSFSSNVLLYFYIGIGGLTTYLGAVVGAILVTILPELLRFSLYDRYLILGLILAAMMVLRPFGLVKRHPNGFFPSFRRRNLWRGHSSGRPDGKSRSSGELADDPDDGASLASKSGQR